MTDMLQRIQARVIEEGECWLWQGAMSGSGSRTQRPCVNWGGKTQYVRRIVWTELHGRITRKGWVVVAKCGHDRCVSPECLTCVSFQRAKQMAAARGVFSSPAKIRKTALTVRARSWITDDIVGRVRGARTAKEAAEATGVSLSHCKAIRRGAARVDYASPIQGMAGMLLAANTDNRRAAA